MTTLTTTHALAYLASKANSDTAFCHVSNAFSPNEMHGCRWNAAIFPKKATDAESILQAFFLRYPWHLWTTKYKHRESALTTELPARQQQVAHTSEQQNSNVKNNLQKQTPALCSCAVAIWSINSTVTVIKCEQLKFLRDPDTLKMVIVIGLCTIITFAQYVSDSHLVFMKLLSCRGDGVAPSKKAVNAVTTFWDCISTFASVKPLDILKETSDNFHLRSWWQKQGSWTRNLSTSPTAFVATKRVF